MEISAPIVLLVSRLVNLSGEICFRMLLGLLCGGLAPRYGRVCFVGCTALLSLWLGAQTVYFSLCTPGFPACQFKWGDLLQGKF